MTKESIDTLFTAIDDLRAGKITPKQVTETTNEVGKKNAAIRKAIKSGDYKP